MKFTRTTWISLFVTVFLLAAVVLYLMYNGASKDNKLAQDNLNAAKLSQKALNNTKSDLSTQMAQAIADVAAWNDKLTLLQTALAQASLSLKQAQDKFPTSAQTIEYNETLIGLAKSSNLTMQLLAATEPEQGNLSTPAFTFYTNVFTLEVSGKVSDILDFVNKITTNSIFATGAISPVSFTIPLPLQPPPSLSQAVVDQMRADIKTKMIADQDASIVGVERVILIEQALLTLLGENYTGPTVTQMTQMIHEITTTQFGPSVADLLSNEITVAIEKNLADSLISNVADVYSEAIAEQFTDDKTSSLLPVFNGTLGVEITAAIQGITAPVIPATVNTVITNALNSMVAAYIAAMVSDSSVDAALNAAVAEDMATRVAAAQAAQPMPSAQLTVAVFSYKGD